MSRERLERLLGGEALARLRVHMRGRFARNQVQEQLVLQRLAAHERAAFEGLLGRRARSGSSLRVSLAELDGALVRAGLATSFRHALELLDGPIPDLLAARADEANAWEGVFAGPRDARLTEFVARAAERGLVKRLALGKPEVARGLLESAAAVLACLPLQGAPRSQLAADVLGDAHALDQGRAVATLVLALLREDADEADRDTWARHGVLVNELAAPALVFKLHAELDSPLGRQLALAGEQNLPVHLSLRNLLRDPPRFRSGQRVFVCENPNLVAIAADRLGAHCSPLVCTDGMPSASQRVLLRQLAAAGAQLVYHGDFDWPGVRIGNFVMRTFGASAWRFGARDYVARAGRLLDGSETEALWDAELAPAMREGGYALEEEAVARVLLDDLATG